MTIPEKRVRTSTIFVTDKAFPVGLLGEQRNISFVFSSQASNNLSGEKSKSSLSTTGRYSTSLISAHTLYIP